MKTEFAFGQRREAQRHAALEKFNRPRKAVSPLRSATALQNFAALLLCVLALIPSAGYAITNDLTALLQQGLFEEQANRNLDAAIADYQMLAAQFDKERQLAATAVFRLGECYRAQGKTNEAAAQYQRVLKEFSDQTTLATLSRQNLVGMGARPEISDSPARLQQKELLAKQIALAEQDLVEAKKKFEVGAGTTQADIRAAEREVLRLQQQLAALDSNKAELLDLSLPVSPLEDQEIARIQRMIQNSPDLINALRDGNTPLGDAAAHGWLKVTVFLLDHGADVNGGYGTALFSATKAGNRAMVELLLSRGANVNADTQDTAKNTPLHIATMNGFQAVIEVLLANKADVNAKTRSDYTPLLLAAQKNNPKIISLLLEHKADVNAQSQDGGTPLTIAASAGQLENVKLLLAAGANPNATNKIGRTPLSFAAEGNSPEMVKILVAAKADPNGGKLDAPLLAAIQKQDVASAELLLQAGANPNVNGRVHWTVSLDGNTYGTPQIAPMFLAVSTKQLPMVQLLLKFKADPNVSRLDGEPVMFSALDKPDILEALLNAGGKVDSRQRNSWPLFLSVVGSGNLESIQTLLKHGADVNPRDGNPALYWAATWLADRNVFELLLNNKADPNVRGGGGKTPLDLLKEKMTGNASATDKIKATELADLLRQHGALDNLPDWDRITVSRPSTKYAAMVFQKGMNDWNHFTLLEFIYQSSRFNLSFPDLAHIVVVRPLADGATNKRIVVNLLNATNGVDCSRDMPLEFGDVVEIPEREHTLAETGMFLTKDQEMTILNYFRSQAGEAKLIVAGGQTVQIPLQAFYSQIGEVLKGGTARSVLTSSSDLARVKVTRRDPKTNKTSEWILDCSDQQSSSGGLGVSPGLRLPPPAPVGWAINGNNSPPPPSFDLWLRAGDVIEVPEKP